MLSPGQVLEEQAKLAERFRNPSWMLVAYMRAYANDKMGRVKRAPMMFYPTLPAESDEEARLFLQIVSADLLLGTTYQVTSHMVDVLQSVYAKSAEGLEHIDRAELPSERGFLWYDKPVELIDRNGKMISMRAMSWGPQVIRMQNKGAFGQTVETSAEGMRLLIWNRMGDPCEYDIPPTAWQDLGELQIDHSMVFPFGERFPVKPDNYGGDSVLHYAHVTCMLLGSEIAAHSRAHIDRASKRRARAVKHGEVTVITLRRSRSDGEDPDNGHQMVDWSCRWVVQGHWRHIESYQGLHHQAICDHQPGEPRCVVCGARLTWVRPCVKGPDYLPLRETRKLYRLSQ